jgi:hypothetical protein
MEHHVNLQEIIVENHLLLSRSAGSCEQKNVMVLVSREHFELCFVFVH